jgi:hypothetical protein
MSFWGSGKVWPFRVRLFQCDLGWDPCGDTQEEGEAGSGDDRTLPPQGSTAKHSHAGRVSSSRVEPSLSTVLSSHDPGSVVGFSTQWWAELRRFAFPPTGNFILMGEFQYRTSGGEQSVMNITCALCRFYFCSLWGWPAPSGPVLDVHTFFCWALWIVMSESLFQQIDVLFVYASRNHCNYCSSLEDWLFSNRLMFSLFMHLGIIAIIFPP